MKKFIGIILAIVMIFSLCACQATTNTETLSVERPAEITPPPDFKVGLICLHDENSTYDNNFIEAFNAACKETGVTGIIKTGVGENSDCYEAAVDLAESGCSVIFADSFGHEDYMIQAAKEYPNVQFCHATGTKAHTEGLANYHNAFASIYEGRYLTGVAAGLKLAEILDSKSLTNNDAIVGYVGALPYAEVISGYSAFYLGVKSIVPYATMKVVFTGSWYDETAEKEAANILIDNGALVLSAHADSMGMPNACQTAGIPFVAYNGSFKAACPDTYIISTRINWQPYFRLVINCTIVGASIESDYVGTLGTGSVEMCELNEAAAASGTQKALEDVIAKFANGNLNVFSVRTFTTGGKEIDSYKADVDSDPKYEPDTEVIENGVFYESKYRSAPYFDIAVDGIELLGN